MKLLIAPAHYYLNETTGSEQTRVYECIKALSKDKEISGDAITGFCELKKMGNINIHCVYKNRPTNINSLNRLFFPFLIYKKSINLIRHNSYDILWHIGPFAINKTFNLITLLNLKKLKFIVGPIYTPFDRDKFLLLEKENKKNLSKYGKTNMKSLDSFLFTYFSNLTKYLSDLTLKKADKIITIEDSGKSLLEKKGLKNIETLHLGTIKDNFKTRPRVKKNNYYNLLTICYLLPRKRVSDIITALHKLVYEYKKTNLHLTIVGDGPMKNFLMHLAIKMKIKKYITFTGFVPRPGVHKFFVNSDIFIFASVLDTMPAVYFEAMTASLPMVIAENDSANELKKDGFGGFVVPGKRPEKMAEAIYKIISNNKLYTDFSKRNYALSNGSYSFDRSILRLKNILFNHD
jgi:glycosyltransferase involved in cell wall biosynthesis